MNKVDLTLGVICLILNAICSALYFCEGRIGFGIAWLVSSILWLVNIMLTIKTTSFD